MTIELTFENCWQYSGLLSCKSGLVYCSDGQDAMGAIMQNDASNADYINEIMGE